MGSVIAKTVGTNTYSYYYDGVNLLFTKKNDTTENIYLYDEGTIYGAIANNGVGYWYCTDIRGSVTNILKGDVSSNSSTTLDTSYTYSAYGETDETVASGSTFKNDIAYTGAVVDSETGLYYLMSRYYDPTLAQFISEDSYRGDGEAFWHLYKYCDNDPVNRTDRTGNKARSLTNKQKKYLKNEYKKKPYGAAKSFVYSTYSSQNCYGYALGVKKMIDPGYKNNRNFFGQKSSVLANYVIQDVFWLSRWARKLSYKDAPILKDEYRIVVASGKPDVLVNGYGGHWDYHFLVQTSSGSWAQKFTSKNSSLLSYSFNPNSTPWALGNQSVLSIKYKNPIYLAVTYKKRSQCN